MIRENLIEKIARDADINIEEIPRRYEILGKSIIMSLDSFPENIKLKIAKAYVNNLKLWSFYELLDIEGTMRIPSVKLLFGINTDVMHKENKIVYYLNPAKVMFSKGNKYERHRLAYVVNNNETVVDMFAGIGYYSIPLSMKAKRVYACEINPESFHYLLMNKKLNKSEGLIPYFGNSLYFPYEKIADRILMGHFDSLKYLEKAFGILKEKGTIHVHSLVRRRDDTLLRMLKEMDYVKEVTWRVVKSYSPSVDHLVFDVSIEKK